MAIHVYVQLLKKQVAPWASQSAFKLRPGLSGLTEIIRFKSRALRGTAPAASRSACRLCNCAPLKPWERPAAYSLCDKEVKLRELPQHVLCGPGREHTQHHRGCVLVKSVLWQTSILVAAVYVCPAQQHFLGGWW